MNSLFHKNDGYASPIVLNPYRNDGVIDMKTETSLTRSRLTGIMIEAEKKTEILLTGIVFIILNLCLIRIEFY